MKRWLIVLVLCLLVLPVEAATRYVSTTGSDTNTCSASTLLSMPKRNLMGTNGALACMSAGDTLYLRQGTYDEAIWSARQTLPTGTSWSNAITIASYPNETATLRPTTTSTAIALMHAYVKYLIFDRITVDGNGLTTYGGADTPNNHALEIGEDAHHVRFQNGEMFGAYGPYIMLSGSQATGTYAGYNEILHNRLHDAKRSYGLYINSQNNLVEGNEIYNNAGYGLQAYGYTPNGTGNLIIRNNKFYGNGFVRGYGAMILSSGTNVQAYNNLIYNNLRGIDLNYDCINCKVYNNTLVGNYLSIDIATGVINADIKNNILFQTGTMQDAGSGTTVASNLCSGSGTGCTITNSDPLFVSAAGGNYRISAAGSPANQAGVNLGSLFTSDADNLQRPAMGNWTIGAYEFLVTAPPTPIGNFAAYAFDENTGLAAGDSSGQGHTLTLSSAGWGAPIIGVSSFMTNGSRYASVPLAAGMAPPTTIGLVGWWNGTSVASCDLISLGDSVALRLESSGELSGFFFNGTTWLKTISSPVNLFDGQSHMVWMTKSATAVRVGVDTIQLGSSAITGTITYTQGNQLVIGKHGKDSASFTCPTGRIDQVRLFDTELTPTAILNLYNEQVPVAGLSVTHMGWFAPNAPEGVAVGAMDTNLNQLITMPVGVRWSIHKEDPGTLTEYFRPFCRVLSTLGAVMLDWTEITNSFGSTGIRFYADSTVTTGTPTSVRLPTDGFTGAAGIYLENPVDTSSPYDAPQRVTLSQAGHAELEMKIEFGSPRVAGERIECRPQRENGAPFTTYMGSLP